MVEFGSDFDWSDVFDYGEIIVIVECCFIDLQKMLIVIFVFGGQFVQDCDICDVCDLVGQVFNLFVLCILISYIMQIFLLCGVGESDLIQEFVFVVYVDDVYILCQIGQMVEFNDFEWIELLCGLQGIFYGCNFSVGVLWIIICDFDQEMYLKVVIGYGSKNEVDVCVFVSGLLSDMLVVSFFYIYYSCDGVMKDLMFGYDVNCIDVDLFWVKLCWILNVDFDV